MTRVSSEGGCDAKDISRPHRAHIRGAAAHRLGACAKLSMVRAVRRHFLRIELRFQHDTTMSRNRERSRRLLLQESDVRSGQPVWPTLQAPVLVQASSDKSAPWYNIARATVG